MYACMHACVDARCTYHHSVAPRRPPGAPCKANVSVLCILQCIILHARFHPSIHPSIHVPSLCVQVPGKARERPG